MASSLAQVSVGPQDPPVGTGAGGFGGGAHFFLTQDSAPQQFRSCLHFLFFFRQRQRWFLAQIPVQQSLGFAQRFAFADPSPQGPPSPPARFSVARPCSLPATASPAALAPRSAATAARSPARRVAPAPSILIA